MLGARNAVSGVRGQLRLGGAICTSRRTVTQLLPPQPSPTMWTGLFSKSFWKGFPAAGLPEHSGSAQEDTLN